MFDMMKLPPEIRVVYRKEKHDHDRYCDGNGVIHVVNHFTLNVTETKCKYCLRLERHRNAKRKKVLSRGQG